MIAGKHVCMFRMCRVQINRAHANEIDRSHMIRYTRPQMGTRLALVCRHYFIFKPLALVRTSSESILTSSKMDWTDLLLSLPLVNGTIQKLHMFSQPLMIDLETPSTSPLQSKLRNLLTQMQKENLSSS